MMRDGTRRCAMECKDAQWNAKMRNGMQRCAMECKDAQWNAKMRNGMRRCAMECEDAQLCKLSASAGMHRASAGKCPGYMMVMLRCEAQWS
jgi:hypothetical protein